MKQALDHRYDALSLGMNITIALPDYDASKGMQHVWVPGHEISVSLKDYEVLINANAAGLRSLANFLLYMAQNDVPIGCHTHLDEHNGLGAGPVELVIAKQDGLATS